ncbi:phage tail tape measure protein [Clostridium beijerinckii]|uniref:Nucleic acid-binding Zn-ribbon protein n=1 Tax=Clostridium beijerinckii TaxID=1520 RepID=A0AAX0B6F0_CLOBE|nr:phage tail tape measure protein [Clostridium beijerinckii]NRT90023.1 putative nucleic acid-binding Zn-ribbon protein [Clostridium beijerinckii]NYC69554.1 putative nucleic acid-binding Zn-ribbon protein [Clostridium beijerinckii]
MANDGKIIIDTKLDTSGFEKDVDTASKKVADGLGKGVDKAMKQAESSINNVGKAAKNIDFSKIPKQLENVSKSIEKTSTQLDKQKEKLENLKKAYENATNVKDQNKIASQMEKAEASITKLETKLNSLNNKKISLDSAKDAINGLDGNFSSASMSATKSIDNIKKKVEEAEKSFKNFSVAESISKTGKLLSNVGDSFTRNVTAPLTLMGAVALKTGADFDAQMSRVKAISGATGEEFKQLHDQALQLGKDTAFSARHTWHTVKKLAA